VANEGSGSTGWSAGRPRGRPTGCGSLIPSCRLPRFAAAERHPSSAHRAKAEHVTRTVRGDLRVIRIASRQTCREALSLPVRYELEQRQGQVPHSSRPATTTGQKPARPLESHSCGLQEPVFHRTSRALGRGIHPIARVCCRIPPISLVKIINARIFLIQGRFRLRFEVEGSKHAGVAVCELESLKSGTRHEANGQP
jgi:hypothetical protein